MIEDRERLDELLARAQGGDIAAFERLIAPHTATVRRFARAFVRDAADADDLAQEALLKAYRSIRAYEGRGAFSTWLFRITRNVCIDGSRRRWAVQRGREGTELSEHDPSDRLDPSGELESAQERAEIWAALERLPVSFRGPLLLFEVEGLQYQEIAEVEQVPVGTVRSRISRGRAMLREALQHLRPAAPAVARNFSKRDLVQPSSEES